MSCRLVGTFLNLNPAWECRLLCLPWDCAARALLGPVGGRACKAVWGRGRNQADPASVCRYCNYLLQERAVRVQGCSPNRCL